LAANRVDVHNADSAKGLRDLHQKIQSGEASVVYDPTSQQVYRIARVVRVVDATMTIQGRAYMPFEMVQIISPRAPSNGDVVAEGGSLSSPLSPTPRALVRNTGELWETLHRTETDYVAAAQRGVGEELGIPVAERSRIEVTTEQPTTYIEEPIDWPGIRSVLTEVRATAVIPEDLSKPGFVEKSADGTKTTIIVAVPREGDVLENLKIVWPDVQYAAPRVQVSSPREQLIRDIMRHADNSSMYTILTGGGGEAIHDLARYGGSSKMYSGARFPYSTRETAELLGYDPGKYVSSEVSEGLANAAYLQAQANWVRDSQRGTEPPKFIGLGVTAAIATNRQRRGENAVWMSVKTPDGLYTGKFTLSSDWGDEVRERHNDAIATLALNALAQAVGANQMPFTSEIVSSGLGEGGTSQLARVAPDNFQLERPCLIMRDGTIGTFDSISPEKHIIYPGSFRGFTAGHDLLARKVQEATGKGVILEISVSNADKAGIDRDEVARRLVGARGRYEVLLVQKPLFVDKSRLYPPGTQFALGMDTALRLVDPRYYGNDVTARDRVLGAFGERRNRFWVMPRRDESGKAKHLGDIAEFRDWPDLFKQLHGALDVSSTMLHGPRG